MKKIKEGNKIKIKKDRIKVGGVSPDTWYTIKCETTGEDRVKGLKHTYELVEIPYLITRKDIKEMKKYI